MSVGAIEWALNQPIGGTEKIILIGIANHVGADDSGWVYMERLQTYANVDERNVRRAIERLIDKGYLDRDVRAGGTDKIVNPRYRPNRFQLCREGAIAPSGGGAGIPSGGGAIAPSLIEEPSTEPSTEPEQLPAPAVRKGRRRDLLFEQVCWACGIEYKQLTTSGRGGLNKAVSELRLVGATPGDVTSRALNYKLRYPDTSLTPTALAKHWASLGEPPRNLSKREVTNRVALQAAANRRKEIG